jgi:hypothetical protein
MAGKGMDSMTRLTTVDRKALLDRVRLMVDEAVGQVMDSVNAARDGYLIADSEVAANDILNDLKRRVYQEALQARIDATEASFSPGGRGDGQAS